MDNLGVHAVIQDCLTHFSPISLEQMGGVKLMNRIDTKYVVSIEMLPAILEASLGNYFVQEIDCKRIATYDTLYYDTPELDMYTRHHNRQLVRQKVRVRQYLDTNQTFLEVKQKNNKGRTKKKRILVHGFEIQSDSIGFSKKETYTVEQFISQKSEYTWSELLPHLNTQFQRITLVNKAMTERLTIDFNLFWKNILTDRYHTYTDLVIVELKRDGHIPSMMTQIMLGLRIHPMKISKYCIGTVLTTPHLKQNRFKQKLRKIDKLLTNIKY